MDEMTKHTPDELPPRLRADYDATLVNQPDLAAFMLEACCSSDLHSAHRRHDISSITGRPSDAMGLGVGTQRNPQEAENLPLQVG